MVEAAQTEVTGQIEVIEAQLDGLTEEDEAYISLLEQKTALEAKQTELAQQLHDAGAENISGTKHRSV